MQCDSQRHSQSAAPSTSFLLDEWVRSWRVRDLGAGEMELVSDFAWGFASAPIRVVRRIPMCSEDFRL